MKIQPEVMGARCGFVFVDSCGAFRRCEAVPAPGRQWCAEHEGKMTVMVAEAEVKMAIHAEVAAGALSVEAHAEALEAIHAWRSRGILA